MDSSCKYVQAEIQNFLVRRLGEKEAAEIMEYINTEIDNRKLLKKWMPPKKKSLFGVMR